MAGLAAGAAAAAELTPHSLFGRPGTSSQQKGTEICCLSRRPATPPPEASSISTENDLPGEPICRGRGFHPLQIVVVMVVKIGGFGQPC